MTVPLPASVDIVAVKVTGTPGRAGLGEADNVMPIVC